MLDVEATIGEVLGRFPAVPGVAVGVVHEDGSVDVAVAGSRGAGAPVEHRSVFAAASLSKPVFAAGVMKLVDAGELDIDRPLVHYGVEPPSAGDHRAASITARMVLRHTTGLPNWRREAAPHLRWAPGTRWGYSGEGYSYLQQVIEALAGTSLVAYMDEAVLRPLGMDDTTFAWDDIDDARLARGHDAGGELREPFRPPSVKAAAGGMFTTIVDYARFLALAVTDDDLFRADVDIDEGLAWGLGWGIEKTSTGLAAWQWGDDPGHKNFVIARELDRRGVVVLTNGDGGAAAYSAIVRRALPGPHPALDVWDHPAWVRSWSGTKPTG